MSLPENISIVYHSPYGHTAKVASAIAAGAEVMGVKVHLMNIEHIDWDALDASHGIILVRLPMGSMTADFKSLWTVLLNVGKSVCGKESLQLDLQTQVV